MFDRKAWTRRCRGCDRVAKVIVENNRKHHGEVWTQRDDDFLKRNFEKYSYFELSAIFGRTVPAVKRRCQSLGLRRYKRSFYSDTFYKIEEELTALKLQTRLKVERMKRVV